jgi:hypothetical protein
MNSDQLALVREGAHSYVDALDALREFQVQVWAETRRVVQPRLNEVCTALGGDGTGVKLDNYSNPKQLGVVWGGAWLTVRATVPVVGSLYFGLCWPTGRPAGTVEVVAMLEPVPELRARVQEHLSTELQIWSNEHRFPLRITADEMGRFAELLNQCIDFWVRAGPRLRAQHSSTGSGCHEPSPD